MNTLTLDEAAVLLKTRPETVSAMIRHEGLPAAKVGRAYVLVDVDVIRWLRTRYARKEKQCDFTGSQAAISGASISVTKDDVLDAALAPRIAKQRKNTRTTSKRDSGAKRDSANVLPLHGTPQS
jgi:excisionase family DNA binding protein